MSNDGTTVESISRARQLWRERVNESRDIGVATLGYLYWSECWAISVLCWLILIIQISMAVILSVSQLTIHARQYDFASCPDTATPSQRALAFFIGLLYIVKIGFRLVEEYTDTKKKNGGLGGSFKCFYQAFVCVDRAMDVVFEPLVYLLNMFVIFRTVNELDMVLNAVALEFILLLDDEFKDACVGAFQLSDAVVDKATAAEARLTGEDILCCDRDCHEICITFFAWLLRVILVCCFLFAAFMTFYFIPCKLGEASLGVQE